MAEKPNDTYFYPQVIATDHYPEHPFAQRRRHGIILVAVLGFIFLMAVFVTQFLDIATQQMRMRAIELGRADLRTTAYSALEVSLAVLAEFQEIDEELTRPSQGWNDPIGYANVVWPEGVTVKVTIEDETGRIPLYPMPEDDIRALLESMDISYSDVDTMVDSLADWQDDNDMHRLNGAEESYYQREEPPYKPANAPITSFDTLSKIQGFKEVMFDEDGVPNELFYRFINSVSLHNTDTININTASPEVIAAYATDGTFDEKRFAEYMAGMDGIPGTSDDEILSSEDDLVLAGFSGNTDAIGYSVAMVRVHVEVSMGEKIFTLLALLDTGGGTSRESDGGSDSDSDNGSDDNSGEDSSGNEGDSSFSIVRLVENANFD